jgi:hypothetical protein
MSVTDDLLAEGRCPHCLTMLPPGKCPECAYGDEECLECYGEGTCSDCGGTGMQEPHDER